MSSSLIHQEIASAKRSRRMIAFHHIDQEPGSFHCAFVLEAGSSGFQVGYVDAIDQPYAEDDAWFEYDEIIWVKAETPYLTGLSELEGKRDELGDPSRGIIIRDEDDQREALEVAAEQREAVSVLEDGESEPIIPTLVEGDWVKADMIHEEDGSLIGQLLYDLRVLPPIRVGSTRERCLTILHRLRYGR